MLSKNKRIFLVCGAMLTTGLVLFLFSRSVNSDSVDGVSPIVQIISENPDDKPSIVLLKHAFWIVHSGFDYDSYKTDLLKSIADEFKVQGASELSDTVNELYTKYKPKSATNSYDYPPIMYNRKWFEVDELVLKEKKYEEAIKLSNNDPFALTMIAVNLYEDTQNKSKAVELLKDAYTQIQPNTEDRKPLVQRIIKSYIEIEEYNEAFQLFKESGVEELNGSQSLPLIEFFTKQQELDVVFDLVSKTTPVDVQAAGLIRIAKYIDNQKPLDEKYRKFLKDLLSSVSPK